MKKKKKKKKKKNKVGDQCTTKIVGLIQTPHFSSGDWRTRCLGLVSLNIFVITGPYAKL
jgi:hypothetical protein